MSSDRAGELGCHRDCLWSNWRKSTGGSWSMFFLQPVAPWGYVATNLGWGSAGKLRSRRLFRGAGAPGEHLQQEAFCSAQEPAGSCVRATRLRAAPSPGLPPGMWFRRTVFL